MKTKTTITFIFIILSSIINAQNLKKNDIVVDVYAGYPNWGRYFTESHINDRQMNLTGQSTGVPHLGAKALFMLHDLFSFTLDFSYMSWGGDWRTDYLMPIYDQNSNIIGNEFINYNFNVQRVRFQIGLNYHYDDLELEELDLYGGLAIGTNTLYSSHSSNDPFFNPRDNMYFMNDDPTIDLPISFRVRIGARYFIRQNIGINLEVGLGGPMIVAGLSIKIPGKSEN